MAEPESLRSQPYTIFDRKQKAFIVLVVSVTATCEFFGAQSAL